MTRLYDDDFINVTSHPKNCFQVAESSQLFHLFKRFKGLGWLLAACRTKDIQPETSDQVPEIITLNL